jgi:hypothetical protein
MSHIRHRLGEKIVGARFQPSHPVGGLVERRHHHHRDMMRARARFEPAADSRSVRFRHHVEQHDLAFGALADRERLVPLMAVSTSKYSADRRASGASRGGNVVNDKDTGGHQNSPLRVKKMADGLDELADRDRL